MIWRAPQKSLEITNLSLPALTGYSLTGQAKQFPMDGLILGGFGADALQGCAVWRKLIETDLNLPSETVILTGNAEAVTYALPKSLYQTAFIAEPNEVWQRALSPLFALISKGAQIPLAVQGLPTEEAWDAFAATARSLFG